MQSSQEHDVTTLQEAVPASKRRSTLGLTRRLLPHALSQLAAATLAILTLRFVVPSRFEGAPGGVIGAVAGFAYRHPLLVGVALFLAISEAGRYWLQRLRAGDSSDAAVAASSRPGWRPSRGLLIALALAAVVAYGLRACVVATFRVVGPSMLPTLQIDDHVLVNRLAYGLRLPFTGRRMGGSMPRLGDLVVFRANGLTGVDGPQSVVKRVVGLPGDRISLKMGILIINGWRVPSCDAGAYVDLSGPVTIRGRLNVEFLGDSVYLTVRNIFDQPFVGYVVQPGEVFVIGDDRGFSSDSRLWNDRRGAGVPVSGLEGRVSRVLVGARPDGRLDFGRLWEPPFRPRLRLPGFNLGDTEKRIADCVAHRPAQTWPPAGVARPVR